MKAARIHGPRTVKCDTVDDPIIKDSRDVILKVTATAICGSDLHIYSGGLPQPRPMTLGHEFMGIVEETGSAVKNLKRGDRVVVPFPIACGSCFFCNHDLPGHCENSNPEKYGPEGGLLEQKGGALFGYTDLYGGYNGGQAQYVRVPYGNHGPSKNDTRLEADRTVIDKLSNIVHAQVGSIKVLKMALSAVRRGGIVSVVGVYGVPYDNFPLGQIFDKGVTLRFGQAPAQKYIDELMTWVEEG